MTGAQRKNRIKYLRKKRDILWRDFCRLPRRSSFSGLSISGKLEQVQQELDKLEGQRKSKRFYPEIDIEIGGML